MNKFEIALLNRAFQNYRTTGKTEGTFQARNGEEWFYNSEALGSLERDGFITIDEDFDPDEKDLSVIIQPVRYELTNQGLAYCRENLKT